MVSSLLVAVAVAAVVPHHNSPLALPCEPHGAAVKESGSRSTGVGHNWKLCRRGIRGALETGFGANNGGLSWRAR